MNKKDPSSKKPWPTKAAMEQVYAMNLWGGEEGTFYSGEGSHNPKLVDPYVSAVTSFLTSFKETLVVCDLGCGDFNIGSRLAGYAKKYIAMDIVADLIGYNRKKNEFKNVEFHCLDLAKDDLPVGDVAIVRQVLQHLSNAEVKRILKKLSHFKYVLLTEHLPDGSFVPNKDITSGQGIRLKKQSGLDVLAPPFNFKVKEAMTLLSVPLDDGKGVIVTKLYTVY